MNTNTFVSHKAQQHLDGREEQRRQVDAICAATRPVVRRPKPARTVWNECLGRYVELR